MNTSIYSQLILLNQNDTDHYLKRYVKLVSFFKERNFKKKKFLHHEHHIIPKSFGGLDTKENLVNVTIREHFILHWMLYKAFPQSSMTTTFKFMCDGWCEMNFRITSKVYQNAMLEFSERQSETARQTQKKLVAEGKHNWQDKEKARSRENKKVAEGRHHWLDKEKSSQRAKKRVLDGTHHWQDKEKSSQRAKKLVAEGKNPFCGPEGNNKRLENGTHPSQIKKVCEHCNREFSLGMFVKYHGNKCKLNPLFKPEPKILCEHCNKFFSKGMFTRHHGDKCKLKP